MTHSSRQTSITGWRDWWQCCCMLEVQESTSTCSAIFSAVLLGLASGLHPSSRHRAEFLGHMKPCESQSSASSGPESGNWTLVDEGGEEDEDPESSWLLLCEEDLISLLTQFPFQQLYSHMLGMSKQGVYEPQACSSQKMMRVFAFASSLIEILALGLQTYNRARYRQLVKRIGHIIRMTVCYVSDHWAQYVSYVSVSTREIYSKVGRELLAAIATAHPHVISVLLERLRETIQTVGMVALYLCKELPLSLWQPRPEEICVIGAWLLQHPLSAVENRLACVILEGLNWGYTQGGSLALSSSLHTEVALLVVEAYQKYLTDKPYSGLISEGIKQVACLTLPVSFAWSHVVESSQAGRVGAAAVLEFWNALGYHGDRGLLSSLVGWIAGNSTPSFIEGQSLSAEVWFAWLVLNMEGVFEEDSQLRRCVEHELLAEPTISPEQALKELWLEFMDQERLQYDESEVLSLWEKVQSEPPFLQTQNPGFTDYTSLNNARERIMSNLQKHPVPRPAPELQQLKVPVAEVPAACLTDSKAAVELLQQDLSILQDQARIAVAREAQQVAMEQELLESLPLLYKNRPEQVTMALEALVNMYKAQKSSAVQHVGVSAFYQIVSFVCEDTLRHPPTRQYLSSCVEILGQVFILNNPEECGRVLKTILEQRRLCPLISPFFTPNAAPGELVSLYQDVVTSLHLDSADVVFMLLTKFDLSQWLNETHPVFSERTRLLELVHGALCVCGRDPEPELLTPFHLFTKHWTWILRHHFPDHYSDCLRMLMTSSSNQLLSPECWKVTLRVLGCLPPSCSIKGKAEQALTATDTPGRAAGPQASSYRSPVSLSPQQVDETVDWLSDYFLRSRVSKPDLRSFGLYSAWTPYINRLLPGQRGALWLCMMQYCESCTSPRTPEYLLYLYHTHLRSLPWRHLHPDTQLMAQLFNVERGSPKSCFLFMGEVLCEVNWVSVLSDHLQTPPASSAYPALPDADTQKESHTIFVYLLYMLFFLAKEEQLLSQQDSPLLSLLIQSTSLPWHQLDLSSYQGILGYVSTHYPPSLLLSADSAPQLLLKSLRSAAGLHPRPNEAPHREETLKAAAYVCWCVQSLVTLEQGGSISLNSLEAQLETLLESIVTFSPPETGLEQRHMAFCGLFSDALALLNGVGVSSGEALAAHVITWLDRKGRGFPILPLLTACTRCLASVRHMTRIMEACITAYFNHCKQTEEESVGWGPVLASLQVPELTVDDFLSESQSGGSFLTLYAFILQRLNTEYTAANERRTLALINTWTNQVFPSGPGDEAKLFLWWHKALNLSAEQLQPQAGQTEVSGVILGLLRLQTRLLQLGEERLNSGLLGAIGLGRRSPVSNRVVVRSLAAFLSIQVPSETEVRLQPTSDLQLSAKAQQTLGMLEAMPSNKQYAELEDSVNKAIQFIRYPGHCLKDAPRLLALLSNLLYPDLRYLHIIR
ncbi:hypothetical protein INR49_006163 [Caranx melampygus]|nr:hypothetical protein INR49_006163 [Caranx melampygus]